jgi:hypothetical protein
MRTILFKWLVGSLGALLYYTLVAAACLGGVMLLDWLLFPRAPDGTLTMAGRCAKAPWHRDSGYRLSVIAGRPQASLWIGTEGRC